MKNFSLTIFLILCTSMSLQAQFGKFLKEKVKEVAKDVIDPEEQKQRLRDKQLQKDTTFYNYAFAQNDKADFFNSKDDNQSILLGALKFQEADDEDTDLELNRYEEAFDHNRKGSNLLFVNDLLAASNFWSALGVYLDEESESDALSSMLVARIFDRDLSNSGNQLLGMMNEITAQDLEQPDYYAIAKTVSNLAIFYHASGQYALASELSEANQVFIGQWIGRGSLAMAAELNNYAVVLRDQGEYSTAEKTFETARQILNNRGEEESLSYALLLNNKAMLLASLGRYTEAEQLLNQCISLAEEDLNTKGSSFTKFKINLGLVKQEQEDYSEAEAIYNEVLALKEKRFGKRHEDYAAVQNNLAALYMETGNEEAVEPLLLNALDIYESKLGTEHPAYASTLVNLGKLYTQTKAFDKAAGRFEQAREIYEQNFGSLNPRFIEVLGELGKVKWLQGAYEEADAYFQSNIEKNMALLEAYFPAMSENEKAKYWQTVRPSLLTYYNYAIARAGSAPQHLKSVYELQLKTKGILLNSTTRVKNEILNGNNESLKNLYNEWINTREQLANYYTYSKAQLIEQKIDLAAIEQSANELEKQLSEQSSAFADASGLPQMKLEDIMQNMKPGEIAIEVIRLPKFDLGLTQDVYYAFLIVEHGAQYPKVALVENGNELETKFANAYRKQIQFQTEDDYSYDKFWAPVAAKISDASKIYLSPDGVYNQVNVLTLKKPDGGYLLDDLQMVTVSSTRSLGSQPKQKTGREIVMVGAPEYGDPQKLAPLPGTRKEIETIASMLKSKQMPVKTYLESAAKEEVFKSSIQSPEILHIATHGFFLTDINQQKQDNVFGISIDKAAENPLLRAGLMFTHAARVMDNVDSKEVSTSNDGILTAYEAMLMDLTDTEMVILSACETGLGEIKAGEGVYGLQRAFQVAGADNIIMSLWKVNDEATQQMMTSFYQNWLASGDREAAFRKAQQSVKAKFEAPYYWGAFVMMN